MRHNGWKNLLISGMVLLLILVVTVGTLYIGFRFTTPEKQDRFLTYVQQKDAGEANVEAENSDAVMTGSGAFLQTEAATEEVQTETESEITPEQLALWQTLEPACGYTLSDGTTYDMLAVDRALGSSYYVAVRRMTDGTISLACRDPYCGSGGESRWITFLSDEQIGFSGLSYSGGSLGSLYRTEDGGDTFTQVDYPSADVALSDGTVYNPFIMPEKVWEEDGILYLLAGQGPDGDYYGEQGFCDGLYESRDQGLTWSYTGEEANHSQKE